MSLLDVLHLLVDLLIHIDGEGREHVVGQQRRCHVVGEQKAPDQRLASEIEVEMSS